MTTLTTTTPEIRTGTRRARALLVPVTAAAAVAAWGVLAPLAGVRLTVRTAGAHQDVGPVAVAVTAVLAVLAGWALLALLERLTPRGARAVWTTVAALVLLVSMLGPLGGADAGSRLGLAALHLVVGGVVIAGLRRTARPA